MKIKKFISAVLVVAMTMAMPAAVFADSVPLSMDGNYIFSEDFSGGTVHNNFVVNTGKIENEKYNINGGRILYMADSEISGGVISIEATFNFSKVGASSRIMAVCDALGQNRVFDIIMSGTGLMNLNAYDSAGTFVGNIELMQAVVNTPYKITAYVDLDSRRLQLAINDKMVLTDRELYINKNCPSFSRLFDSNNSDNNAAYTIDDINAKRIAHLPFDTKVKNLWSEDFSSDFTGSYMYNYEGRENVAENIVEFSTLATDSANHGKVLHAKKGTKLLLSRDLIDPNGIYSIKADMYFTSASVNGVGQMIADNDGKLAAQIRIKDRQIGVTDGSNALRYALTYELNTWYTVDMRFNTTTREIMLFINGKRYLADKNITAAKLNDYKRLCYINNGSNGTEGLYIDNVSVEKISDVNTTSKWERIVKETDFNDGKVGTEFSSIVSGSIDASNGYAIFAKGTRALYAEDITEGVYSIEADVKITGYADDENVIFSTAGDQNFVYVYRIYTQGQNICAGSYTQDNEISSNVILKNYNVNEWYNIRVTFDMASKRVHFYVNDLEALADKELYIGRITEKITRPYDFANKSKTSIEYHIDNLKFYEDKLLEALNIQSRKLMGNITLPTTINSDVNVAWTSDDAARLSAEGVVNTNTATAKFPTLQAKVADGTGYATRRFTFYVPALKLPFEDRTGVVDDINDLPFVTEDHVLVEWSSSNPDIVTATGAVNRPADTTTVVLTAKYGDITKNYNIEVLGMNEENKIFVCENDLYVDDEKMSGKAAINGKTVSYKAKLHNATNDKITATAVFAVYKDGVLEYVDSTEKQEIESKKSGAEFTGLSYTIPAEGNYSVKGMIWDMKTLKPYDIASESSDKEADLFVLSDSIYANYAENAYNDEGGIGMYIGSYLNENITVHNVAYGGASTRSYMKSYFKNKVLDVADEGDYMLVSFGINDTSTKEERYTSEADYKKFLELYVNAARDRGINVFFVTTTPTGTYADGAVTYSNKIPLRRTWMKDVAGSIKVECLELGEMIDTELASLTPEEQLGKYIQEAAEAQGATMVHINKTRASELAGWLTQLIKTADINGLSGYVK